MLLAATGDDRLDRSLANLLAVFAMVVAAIGEFSVAYADQNERDHAELLKAVDDGRIVAQQGL